LSTKERLSREEEERLWIVSIVPLVPVMVGVIAYLAYLKSNDPFMSFYIYVFYSTLVGICCLAVGVGIYEVASSFKVKKPLSFRVKRFLSRTALTSAYLLCVYLLWSVLILFSSWFLKEEYTLVLSLFTISLVFSILVRNPKTGRFIKKLTQDDN